MKDYVLGRLRNARLYLISFLKWLLICSFLGSFCGLVGAAFHGIISNAASFRLGHTYVIWFLPLGGALIAWFYEKAGQHKHGTHTVIDAVLNDGEVPPLLAPSMFAATALTHFLGGSAGREGAALQIGGSLGSLLAVKLNLKPSDRRIAILSGMATVFTALFGTPVGAALFVLELSNVGTFCYSALVPCMLSSGAAFAVTQALHIAPTRFSVSMPELSLALIPKVLLLAALCAVLSILICFVIHKSKHRFGKLVPNRIVRGVIGGCLLLILTLLAGTQDYNGAGEPVFRRAIEQGECSPWAFLLKLLFTAVTLASGFKGGEVVPTFFIGATFGCTIGPLLGLPAGFAAAVGMAATFAGATNCPLSTILLSAELFGGGRIELFALVCAVSYLFSGYASLYPNQRFLYSKTDGEKREV